MRSEVQVNEAIDRYADTVYRIAVAHIQNEADAEDIFQKVFMKCALFEEEFDSPDYERAWLIRVTINACRDMHRDFFRRHAVSLDSVTEAAAEDTLIRAIPELTGSGGDVWAAVRALPAKYQDVIYLYYYEEYTAPEIGRILGKNVNTVYTLLNRAKKILQKQLEGEVHEQ